MRVRVASAGTGKTTSLVLSYLEVIASGVPLRRIAGVTFTRSAAHELRQRVGEALDTLLEEGSYLHFTPDESQRSRFEEARRQLDGALLTTIHGFMGEALRLNAPLVGLDPDFGILPEWEAQAIFEEEVDTVLYLAQEPDHPLFDCARRAQNIRRRLAQLFMRRSLSASFSASGNEGQALLALYDAAHAAYLERLGARLLTPAELERRALRLLDHDLAARRLVDRYLLAFIDEYQDVNPLQGSFFEGLEARGMRVEVVGDPKQSIYGFRNADVTVFRRARAAGEELPPLTTSYRHADVISRMLNRLVQVVGEKGTGFRIDEAPAVHAIPGAAAGRVEAHWVVGRQGYPELREAEANVLAQRLLHLHQEEGIPWQEMAVIAKGHGAIGLARGALERVGIPATVRQGRGFYQLPEVKDLGNALRAALDPQGVPFAAFLAGPFGGLDGPALAAVLAGRDRLARLQQLAPQVYGRFRELERLVALPPAQALKELVRAPLIDGRSYFEVLDEAQRLNVDALLFTLTRDAPEDLQLLLERLDELGRDTETGEVPGSGAGVALLTVHGSKGLEWPVVAVFDCSRGAPPFRDEVIVEAASGLVHVKGEPGFAQARSDALRRAQAESERLLYVAASRPRERLIFTGSARLDYRGEPRLQAWAALLDLCGLGPEARISTPEIEVCRYDAGFRAGEGLPRKPRERPEPAPWTTQAFTAGPLPPLVGPSALVRFAGVDDDPVEAQPDRVPLGLAGESVPGRASAIGTLVHYAISQSWHPENEGHMDNLRAQEVMFPFSQAEQDEIMSELRLLLRNYWSLLGAGLPGLEERDRDEAELPVAAPFGPSIIQGVVDRLYRVQGQWYLDDYKTDRTVRPERYHAQLAVYMRVVEEALGVTPRARLVYLRPCTVVEVDPLLLRAEYESLLQLQERA